MFSKMLNFATFCGVSLLINACALPPQYTVTPLNEEAKRVVFTPSKPAGCMFVGEQEGYANATGTMGATMELLRESARNDLRNNATHLMQLGQSKRFLVYVAQSMCRMHTGVEVKCDTLKFKENPNLQQQIQGYRVYGDIYECKW